MKDTKYTGYKYDLIYKSDLIYEKVGKLFYIIENGEIVVKSPKIFLPVTIMENVGIDLFERFLKELIPDNPTEVKTLTHVDITKDQWTVAIDSSLRFQEAIKHRIQLSKCGFHLNIYFNRVIPSDDDSKSDRSLTKILKKEI